MEAARNPWAVLLATVVALALVGLLAVYYRAPNARSVLIEADTQYVHIPFAAEETWRLPEAIICRERARTRQPVASSPTDAGCGSDLNVALIQTVNWQDGAAVDVLRKGYGQFQVVVESALQSLARNGQETVALEDGDRIILPATVQDFGPVQFSGDIQLGTSGPNSAILLGGEYEWRERLFFRERPERIETEVLRAGDIVTVDKGGCNGESNTISGMIFPSPLDEPGLKVVMSAADSAPEFFDPLGLCLTRYGFERTFIEPRWSARILNDPMTYALGVLLTIALTVFPAVLGLWNIFVREDEE